MSDIVVCLKNSDVQMRAHVKKTVKGNQTLRSQTEVTN